VSFQGFPALAEEAVGGALRLKASQGGGGKASMAFARSSGLPRLWSHGG